MTKQPKCQLCGRIIHHGRCAPKPTLADIVDAMPDWARDAWLHGNGNGPKVQL